MAKTTYLLGAGASYDSLPVVKNFEEELLRISTRLDYYIKDLSKVKAKIDIDVTKELILVIKRDIDKLYEGCRMHRSVDTYLRKLFLIIQTPEDESRYRIAKCSIILFFEIYRFLYNKSDYRYDAFLATVLKKKTPRLPNHINILSWNYDYEFERAYLKYAPEKDSVNDVYQDLNIIHKNSKEERSIANNFGILKINGTAGFFHKNETILGLGHSNLYYQKRTYIERYPSTQLIPYEDVNDILPLLKNYFEFTHNNPDNYTPAISFAWEDGNGMKLIKEEIKKVLSNTEKLIIIGYSFPYFNREIDKYIMSCLNDVSKVKIYVQDTQDRVNDLIESIKELNSFEKTEFYTTSHSAEDWLNSGEEVVIKTPFIPKTDLTQFYMAFD